MKPGIKRQIRSTSATALISTPTEEEANRAPQFAQEKLKAEKARKKRLARERAKAHEEAASREQEQMYYGYAALDALRARSPPRRVAANGSLNRAAWCQGVPLPLPHLVEKGVGATALKGFLRTSAFPQTVVQMAFVLLEGIASRSCPPSRRSTAPRTPKWCSTSSRPIDKRYLAIGGLHGAGPRRRRAVLCVRAWSASSPSSPAPAARRCAALGLDRSMRPSKPAAVPTIASLSMNLKPNQPSQKLSTQSF